jgi:transposase, IS5 family
LPEVLNQVEKISNKRPKLAIVDRGYRGKKQIQTTQILIPSAPPKNQTSSERTKIRKCFRRRSAIEPIISHLKYHFRILRCFLKGFVGDQINLMLSATAWNFQKWMRLAAH